MKQFLFSVLFVLSALTVSAQDNKAADMNERFFEAKVRELVYRVKISDEQKPKFVNIYRRYCDDMRAAWGERKKPTKPANDEEAVAKQKQKMERQLRAQAVRVKYVDEFSTVLTPKQVSMFYAVDSQIQQKLKARKGHPKGNNPLKGKHMKKKQKAFHAKNK